MKILYLDCGMGVAGDMLGAALVELMPDPKACIDRLNGIGIPNVTYSQSIVQRCGIMGTHLGVRVNGVEEGELMDRMEHAHDHEHHHVHDHEHPHMHEHEHHHVHRTLGEIEAIVNGLNVSAQVRADILAVYKRIAEAESHVHGRPVSDVHFHEIGAMDAIADIAAACSLIEMLAPDEIAVSPVRVGSGTVRCAHGLLPVPAPATAYLLKDVPIFAGDVSGELCTPTGAALLTHFANRFGTMPLMRVRAIGYGMGTKVFPDMPGCVRALWGITE